MTKYRNMRCRKTLTLLVGIVSLIGCGSTTIKESHRRESEIEVLNAREVKRVTADMQVVEAEKRSRAQTPEEERDREVFYLDEVTRKRVDKEETNRGENEMDETVLREFQRLETRSEGVDRKKESKSQSEPYDETGIAAFISDEYDGAMTASGGRYDRNEMTAAHPSLPFDTKIVVTNLRNKRSVEVVIIDRFYPSTDRILNVSHRAAEELDLIESGVAKVGIRIIGDPE
ncbi:MAG: septal ring lytic transglycosylase RlpA family protein [Candidatus Scalindua sp. AMX11]|nr:MAG: septal ring lytic transglycosylase RlpA family protein [Candidatus Scalindua sp.]NOG82509.1 septal ring lytic transglycosylase RlpA family protein [Planctomycetota bacterium]RZV93940.1 MAG: septal ring lytic transglycosylase RlpA family protein [Candidatus Scalindua sp. SCAELEC01]TDE65560.1 MAG: septal ring lytic transglycosylase RlpA family protein [Candidatus Scalindua sp. AMX11]GJQ58143.1 MAG: hypothetical protein SCALA701_09440 [Candidatus Scalindua sp.]